MDSLLTLIDRWHPAAAHTEEHPNDFEASQAADEARHALELRLLELAAYAEGLYHAHAPGAYGILNRLDPQRWPNHEQRMAMLEAAASDQQ